MTTLGQKEWTLITFTMVHQNFNVADLHKSLAFYEKALGLQEVRRKESPTGDFILVYLEDGNSAFQLELTWLRDRETPYNLGDEEFHLAFTVDDFDKALALHKEMNCVAFENAAMGIYFITDPDGYWLEIIPQK